MPVEFQVDDDVAVITLNRPEALNAINRETSFAVEAAVKQIDDGADIRCAVITGAGGNFSTGIGLKAFLSCALLARGLPRLPRLNWPSP